MRKGMKSNVLEMDSKAKKKLADLVRQKVTEIDKQLGLIQCLVDIHEAYGWPTSLDEVYRRHTWYFSAIAKIEDRYRLIHTLARIDRQHDLSVSLAETYNLVASVSIN